MTKSQTFIQTMLLLSNGLMLTKDEIDQLDWSELDGLNLEEKTAERGLAIFNMGKQIDALRNR